MAEIIKKEYIKVRNGGLKKLCKKFKTSIHKVSVGTGINEDHLYRFDRGEKRLSWENWETLMNYFDNLNNK